MKVVNPSTICRPECTMSFLTCEQFLEPRYIISWLNHHLALQLTNSKLQDEQGTKSDQQARGTNTWLQKRASPEAVSRLLDCAILANWITHSRQYSEDPQPVQRFPPLQEKNPCLLCS